MGLFAINLSSYRIKFEKHWNALKKQENLVAIKAFAKYREMIGVKDKS